MSPAAMLLTGVFSFCTPDGCVAGPPLRIYPSPMNRQYAPPPPPRPAAMTRDQEREFIRKQGERFCLKYPDDMACNPAQGKPQ